MKKEDQHRYYQPAFKLAFLHPRFWWLWLILGLMFTSVYWPSRFRRAIGAFFGDLFCRFNHKRRRIILINLRLCFPDLTDAERERMMRVHCRRYGQGVLEYALLWWASKKRMAKLIRYNGLQQLYKALGSGRSVIILSYHSVSTDYTGFALEHCLPSFIKSVTIMKPLKNCLLNYFVCRARRRFGTVAVPRHWGLAEVANILRHKDMALLYYTPDEDFGIEHSVMVPFFSTQAATLTSLGRLARIGNAIVIPACAALSEDTNGYNVHFGEPLQDFPTGDAVADAICMNQAFEKMIMLAPEQYMWTMRRFKTRPLEEPSPYL